MFRTTASLTLSVGVALRARFLPFAM